MVADPSRGRCACSRSHGARHARGGVRGSTRPAPDGRSPHRPAQPAARPRQRTTSSRVLARAVREVEAAVQRGRVDAVRAHEVPGRRAAAAGGARPRPGRPTGSDSPACRAAQAPGRHRDDPRQDRRPRRRAAGAARRGRRRVRRGPRRSSATCSGPPASRRPPEEEPPVEPAAAAPPPERRVVPQSVVSRQLANPFLAPDFSARPAGRGPAAPPGRLGAARPAAQLVRARRRRRPGVHGRCRAPTPAAHAGGLELMPHQAQLVAAAAAGHRTFLLADEPGLGKTAQALLAAEAADAYPLLVVVPNVVKTNWAREAGPLDAAPSARPSSTATARRSTASPTSSSSTTRCSTGTWAGSATSASAAWSSTRRTSSRTRPRSARSTCSRSPSASASRTARPAAHGAHRHAADQRHRGLPGDLAVPRLDRRQQAARRADGRARGRPA